MHKKMRPHSNVEYMRKKVAVKCCKGFAHLVISSMCLRNGWGEGGWNEGFYTFYLDVSVTVYVCI